MAEILINGVNATTLGVDFESGTLEQLDRFPTIKPIVTFSSRHIDGVQMDARNGKVEPFQHQLPIWIMGSSESDYVAKRNAFMALLINGKNNTGITELSYSGNTYRLHYESCEPLRIFGNNARHLLTFVEPNPKNR